MKAAIFKDPGQIEMHDDVGRPGAGPGEVLIKVEACGICGTDMHMYRTNAHRAESVRVTDDGREIPGHEYSGVIAEVGAGVEGYQVGDKVVGITMGGMAEYVPVPVNPYQLVKMPEGVSFVEAATTEPLADSLQIVRKAALNPDESVVVLGVGIIGLGVIQVLKSLDIPLKNIVAVDVSDERLAMAAKLGATQTINNRGQDPLEAVREVCGYTEIPFPPSRPPNVDVVIDCAGYIRHMPGDPPLQLALEMLKPFGGRIVCFGAFEDKLHLDLMPLIFKQIAIFGSLGYDPSELTQALQLMADKKIDRETLVSHQFPLEKVGEAFEVQGSGKAIKVVLEPSL